MPVRTQNVSDTLLQRSYRSIIALLCQTYVSNDTLSTLKKAFKRDINSNRTYELISNLEELVQVLERRCVIGVRKINKLFYPINDILGPNERLGLLLNTHARLLTKTRQEPLFLTGELRLITDFCPRLPEPVVDLISSNLKNKWKELGRQLLIIRESVLDSIDETENDNDIKLRQMFQAYVEEAKIQRLGNPYSILFSALEQLKRRDVREKAEDMLTEILTGHNH